MFRLNFKACANADLENQFKRFDLGNAYAGPRHWPDGEHVAARAHGNSRRARRFMTNNSR